MTRIAAVPVPAALHRTRLSGGACAGIHVDALAVHFDTGAWDRAFTRLWPPGSDAARSYGGRIIDGPAFSLDDAIGRSMEPECSALAA